MSDGFTEKAKPLKARDVWPQLKELLNLSDECVKAVRIDIELDGLIEVEVRKYAVAPPTFRGRKD